MSQFAPIFGAVDRAKQSLARGSMQDAVVNLKAASAVADQTIPLATAQVNALRSQAGNRKAREQANVLATEVNRAIQMRGKIRQALQNAGVEGAPNGAGIFARVPFYQKAASGDVLADSEWLALSGAATDQETGYTPDMPYLKYRIHGFVANAPRMGSVIIAVEDLKTKGHPNLFIGEGELGLQSYDGMSALMGGLRAKADVMAPNSAEVKMRAYTTSTGAAEAGAGAEYFIEASAVVEILQDEVYGDINNLARRRSAGSLLSSSVAPGAGWVERVPLLVKTADTWNPAGAVQAKLGWETTATAVTSLTLESESIPYSDSQVIGLEVEYQENVDATYPHILLLEDFKVKGGSSLFPQEGAVPAWNYLGDASEYYTQYVANTGAWRSAGGWGMHKRPALRDYPMLSVNNRIELTVSCKNKDDSDGALGTSTTAETSYIQAWALVNRTHDAVFGAPGGAMEAMINLLG